jgi:replicative DNA helicase
VNYALAALRALASGLSCAVLAVAERNRANMERGGLSASSGSHRIEYGAETVLGLSRKGKESEEATPHASGEVDVILRIEKNRNGAHGKPLQLRFHPALMRFAEV